MHAQLCRCVSRKCKHGVPLTIALTDLMFDFHIRFDLLCEWLTLIPK